MGDILTGTPPDLTYLHPFVRQTWWAVWAVTTAALTVILGWMGLSFIVQEHLGRHQSGWRELAPRLALGLITAASSLWWCALVIAVALGFAFLGKFAAISEFEPAPDLVWKLLMAVVFMYLAGRVPSLLGNHGAFDAWLWTLYFGMSLLGSMVRSARTLGLLAGSAAGGAVNSAAQHATPAGQGGPTPRSQGP